MTIIFVGFLWEWRSSQVSRVLIIHLSGVFVCLPGGGAGLGSCAYVGTVAQEDTNALVRVPPKLFSCCWFSVHTSFSVSCVLAKTTAFSTQKFLCERRNEKFRHKARRRWAFWGMGLSSELRIAGISFFLFIFARFSIFFLAPNVRNWRRTRSNIIC